MKGLMVTLLMMCVANFACAQQSANNEDGGKFVLRLTDELIEDLKVNPGGLSAMIRPEDRGKISEVLILYTETRKTVTKAEPSQPSQPRVVARQDFNTGPGLNATRPPITPGLNSGTSFGSGNRGTANDQNPFNVPPAVARNSEPVPGQDWLPVGDYTDFVPVTRREDWIREIPSRVTPTFQARNDSATQNRNNNLTQPNQWERDPFRNANTPKTDQFASRDRIANDANDANAQNQQAQEHMRLLQFQYNQKMKEYEQKFADQQRQLERQRLEYQQELAEQRRLASNIQPVIPTRTQDYLGPDFLQRNPQPQWNPQLQRNPQPNSNQGDVNRVMAEALAYVVKQKESESYGSLLAMHNNERAITNASIPGRRLASNTESNQRPTSLDAQIPGPNQANRNENVGGRNGSNSTFRGTHSELVANLSSLKKTNGFLLFMLLCSVGINVYLGLISRNFYTRYAELADELRETFTATM